MRITAKTGSMSSGCWVSIYNASIIKWPVPRARNLQVLASNHGRVGCMSSGVWSAVYGTVHYQKRLIHWVKKWNESGFRPTCAHIGWTGSGEHPEDDEMNEMTLSSRHRIRNSGPEHAISRSRKLPTIRVLHVDGEETFLFISNRREPGSEPRTLAWKTAMLTTTLGPPPNSLGKSRT